MSANTSIKEGGTPFPFGPVKALLVEGSDGKYYPWVPESERQLGYKSIDKNGIYRASDDGVYGWSKVSVSVSQATSVTGRDPDTGDEVVVRPDPDTGVLEKETVPSSIEVISPPTVPSNIYVDGQSIVPGDMVVKAYLASGEEYGTVPNVEITLNPNRAVFDETQDHIGTGEATLNGVTIPFALADRLTKWESSEQLAYLEYHPTVDAVALIKNGGWTMYSVGASVPYTKYKISPPPGETSGNERLNPITNSPYYSRQLGYASAVTRDTIPDASSATSGLSDAQIAEVIFEGARTINPPGSPMTITVSWPRSGDGAILETTFDILVGPHGGGGED